MKTTILSTIMLSAVALTACSDETFSGDEPKDWAGTTNLFVQTEDAGYQTYYKPSLGRVGDPMPFYDEKAGEFKVLYLQDFGHDNDPYCFHPIYGVKTKDGANYEGMGEVLPTGKSKNEADAAIGTGCCYYNKADGLYYIYYTGHTSREVIMRATSSDFKTWTKDKWMLVGPDYGLNAVDFRDPQIFEVDGKFHMIVSTRPEAGGDPCFAEFTSDNMKDWTFVERFNMLWERMYECPDVFTMGEGENKYWYIVYSDANPVNWGRSVKYLKAKSWAELKKVFSNSSDVDHNQRQLDARAFYAGKTASNGTDRYIWGWTPYRSGDDIHAMNQNVGGDGEPNWSGALVCHKLVQNANGDLITAEVPAMAAKYDKANEMKVIKQQGDHTLYSRLGTHNHISFVAQADKADAFGISFAHSIDTKKDDAGQTYQQEAQMYYTLYVCPDGDGRVIKFVQDGEFGNGPINGADGYWFPAPTDGKYKVDIYSDNSVVVIYINGMYGYTQRIHGAAKNCWSISNYGGKATFSDVKVTEY